MSHGGNGDFDKLFPMRWRGTDGHRGEGTLPWLSVIVPLRDVRRYLGECLAMFPSAGGLWLPVEGIVVDDGSTDGTGELLLGHLRRAHGKLRCVFQPPSGVSRARNRALRQARGWAIAFVDGDDVADVRGLLRGVWLLRRVGGDALRFGFRQGVRPVNGGRQMRTGAWRCLEAPRVQVWGWGCLGREGHCWRWLIRAEQARLATFPEGVAIAEDSLYAFALLPHLRSVCLWEARPYFYRDRPRSAVRSPFSIEVPLARLRALGDLALRQAHMPGLALRQKAFARSALQAVTDWAYKARERSAANIRCLREAFSETLLALDAKASVGVLPWAWRPAATLFLRFGWWFPIHVQTLAVCAWTKAVVLPLRGMGIWRRGTSGGALAAGGRGRRMGRLLASSRSPTVMPYSEKDAARSPMRFSVILPLRNVAPWLPECLASLRAQTWSDWEGLCVDDGSTDGSGEMLAETLRGEARFRAVFQPPSGVSRARNRALARARGDAVAFLDGDDRVQEWWLAEAARCFRETQADLVRFGFRRVREGDSMPKRLPPPPEEGRPVVWEGVAAREREALMLLKQSACWQTVIRATLARKSVFCEALRMAEDAIYRLRLTPYLRRLCESAVTPYDYRIRAGSTIMRPFPVEIPLAALAEIGALLDERCPVAPKVLARLAFCVVLMWSERRIPAERPRFGEVRRAFSALFRPEGGGLRLKLLQAHWRPAILWYLSGFGPWGIWVTSWVLRRYGALRARFRHA